MVTFDAREPGTPARTWLRDPRLAALPELGLPGRGVVVLAAHPDDETLGAGNLVAELALRGRAPTVVVVTDGAAAPGADGTRDPGLASRRAAELREAVAELAPGADLVTLRFPDGGLREDRDAVRTWLERLVRDRDVAGTPVTTLVAPWSGDGHRDHRVLGEIAGEVARRHGLTLWEYPIWMWHWADPTTAEVPWETLRTFAGGPEAAARRSRALDAHASQVAGPDALVPHDLRRITGRGVDTFVVTEPPVEVRDEDGARDRDDARDGADVTAAFFDATYERRDDPWGFTSRWYEERKRALTLAALPRRRFARAWEVGCSIGVLTAELAERCENLLAVDVAPAAVTSARERLGERDGLSVEVADVTADVPAGPFDLVVLSEVLYYFSLPTLRRFLERLAPALADRAVVVGCHWRHPVTGYALGGDEAQRELRTALAASRGAVVTGRYEDEDVVLEVLSLDGRSVADRDGLL
ncbi:hypothetical protein C8046_13765 [Serinibacter arcticus]|uniref:Methyltransferase type 12 n=1 Tax=Serinibacter arcticus TaxID=1655435 RepID=A0A2U1ZX86_9MICO|nr:bifunctional PIG-L family deacetylase/class I SAM-dependent methyltransferase [Serinibacter arcticus]PWD51553.1 hypothetical protein C8046_13765 [Serinibacter arcticus]